MRGAGCAAGVRGRTASPPCPPPATPASSWSPAGSSSARRGAYVARVVDRKSVGGHHVVILDGGIHHVLRPVLVGQEHRVKALTGLARPRPRRPTRSASRSPSPDRCAPASTSSPRPRSWRCRTRATSSRVLDVGAYGATESMPFFLSHPLPPEVALRGGEAWVARPRVDPDTWLGWQVGEPPAG